MDKKQYFQKLKEKLDEIPNFLRDPFRLQQFIDQRIKDELLKHKAKKHTSEHGGDHRFFYHLGRLLRHGKKEK